MSVVRKYRKLLRAIVIIVELDGDIEKRRRLPDWNSICCFDMSINVEDRQEVVGDISGTGAMLLLGE
ncbi:MAG: hypothetical protein R3C01_10765 [Planctomycetaceae bacterium]